MPAVQHFHFLPGKVTLFWKYFPVPIILLLDFFILYDILKIELSLSYYLSFDSTHIRKRRLLSIPEKSTAFFYSFSLYSIHKRRIKPDLT